MAANNNLASSGVKSKEAGKDIFDGDSILYAKGSNTIFLTVTIKVPPLGGFFFFRERKKFLTRFWVPMRKSDEKFCYWDCVQVETARKVSDAGT